MSPVATQPARASGEFAIGGDLPVVRLGYGAMQIPGPGVWGEPRDHDEAIRVLRRAVELGVTFIDTADSYGPEVSERLIREALHPYPADLVIATKAGFTRPAPGAGSATEDRSTSRPRPRRASACSASSASSSSSCTASIPTSPSPTSSAPWSNCRRRARSDASGCRRSSWPRSRRPGRSRRSPRFRTSTTSRTAAPSPCWSTASAGIGFIPWFPMATGRLARAGGPLQRIADALAVTPAQLALAWLLQRSPVLLPIPGTSTVTHLEENLAAALIDFTPDQVRQLENQEAR